MEQENNATVERTKPLSEDEREASGPGPGVRLVSVPRSGSRIPCVVRGRRTRSTSSSAFFFDRSVAPYGGLPLTFSIEPYSVVISLRKQHLISAGGMALRQEDLQVFARGEVEALNRPCVMAVSVDFSATEESCWADLFQSANSAKFFGRKGDGISTQDFHQHIVAYFLRTLL